MADIFQIKVSAELWQRIKAASEVMDTSGVQLANRLLVETLDAVDSEEPSPTVPVIEYLRALKKPKKPRGK